MRVWAEDRPGSPYTCKLGQVTEGGQRGRWRWEWLTVLDQLLCLLSQPGCFHLGLFQKFPWGDNGGRRSKITQLSMLALHPDPYAYSAWVWCSRSWTSLPASPRGLHGTQIIPAHGQKQPDKEEALKPDGKEQRGIGNKLLASSTFFLPHSCHT